MASIGSALRDEIVTRLTLKRTLSQFIVNDWDIESVWIPLESMETMIADHPNGKCYVVSMASDDDEVKTRTNLSQRNVMVQVGFQKAAVSHQDVAAVDILDELMDQFRDAMRQDVALAGYEWSMNEALKDDEGVPFSYVGMRQGLFEAYFTTFFQHVLQP